MSTPVKSRNYYQSINGIVIPALPRPNLDALRSWGVRKILEDTSPIEEVRLDLGSVLRPKEDVIAGSTHKKRIRPLKGLTLGLQHASWIIENHQKLPKAFNVLSRGVEVYFCGITVIDSDGERVFPCLCETFDVGESWGLNWRMIGDEAIKDHLLAVSGR